MDESQTYSREEIEQVFLAFEKIHEQCYSGQSDWGELAQFLVPDVDYTDPGWGRMHGTDTVTQFLRDSMAGLDAWDFPMRWYAIDGIHVIKKYSMVLLEPLKADGSQQDISGVYMMKYAGDGKFSWVEDQLDMNHFIHVAKTSGWRPGPGFRNPSDVNWD